MPGGKGVKAFNLTALIYAVILIKAHELKHSA